MAHSGGRTCLGRTYLAPAQQRLTRLCWGLAAVLFSRLLRTLGNRASAPRLGNANATAAATDRPAACAANAELELAGLWTLPPRSTVFIVAGLEASGTKEVARVLAHRLLACEYGTWLGSGLCIQHDRGAAVLHKSLPHGIGDCRGFPDLAGIVNKAAQIHGFNVRVVVCVRDKTIALQSSLRAGHESLAAVANLRQQRAAEILRAIIRPSATMGGVHVRIFSFEAYVLLGEAYLAHLFSDGKGFLPPSVTPSFHPPQQLLTRWKHSSTMHSSAQSTPEPFDANLKWWGGLKD